MKGPIEFTAELVLATRRALERKWSFLGVFACAFLSSVVILAELDLLPEAPKASSAVAAVGAVEGMVETEVAPAVAELPVRIDIRAIKLAATISNPESTDIEVLDHALLSGAVRYPTSAKLGEVGNVVLFGHSSYLPIVGNQAYKTFNGIQKLEEGDTITVESEGIVYVYAVRAVMHENTSSAIDLSVTGRVLTLATCDSFGESGDRFVVTADFVESHPAST